MFKKGFLNKKVPDSTNIPSKPAARKTQESKKRFDLDIIKDLERVKMGNNADWSELPQLLLWNIKGRLNIFDKSQFSVVCKHWWSAYQNCHESFKLEKGEREPWIIIDSGITKCERTFLNLSTYNPNNNTRRFSRFRTKHNHFQNATLQSSSNGWLLFTKDMQYPPYDLFVFFIHPLSQNVIEMPCYEQSTITSAIFSTMGNAPHCVVLASLVSTARGGTNFLVILNIARPGEDKWIEFKYPTTHMITHFITLGQRVICSDGATQLLDFDLVNHTWTKVKLASTTPARNMPGEHYIMENKGHIFKVFEGNNCLQYFMLNETKTAWVDLKDDSQGNVWYLEDTSNFMVRGGMNKIYKIKNHESGWIVTVKDMKDNRLVEKEVLSGLYEEGHAYWVDLG